MDKMNITSAKYLKDGISDENSSIKATIDGQELFVPLAEDNRHYKAIVAWVEEGNTIEEAD